MPPKRREKDSTSKQVANDAAVTVVSSTAHEAVHTNAESISDQLSPVTSYQSPLKKLKKTMQRHERKTIDTIDGLREFITHNDVNDPIVRESIRIKARLLWITTDTVYDLHFLRLYFGEHQAPEPLQQQQQEFMEAQREDPFETNQFLITVSLLNVDPNNPELPRPGAVVSISPMKLRLYRNCPQVDAKLHGMTTITDAP